MSTAETAEPGSEEGRGPNKRSAESINNGSEATQLHGSGCGDEGRPPCSKGGRDSFEDRSPEFGTIERPMFKGRISAERTDVFWIFHDILMHGSAILTMGIVVSMVRDD